MILASGASAAVDRTALAMAARERGDNVEAVRLLREVVAAAPRDVDALRLLGTSLAFLHRYPEAISTLERARSLAPRDEDVAIGLARTLLWSGRLRPAAQVVDEVSAADPSNPEVPALIASIEAARREGPAPTVSVSETASRVVIGSARRIWSETAASLSAPLGRSGTLSGGVDVEDRSGTADTRVSARLDRRFAWGTAYAGATYVPDASFRETWSALTGVAVPLAPFLLTSLEVRRSHYDLVDITIVEPGIEVHSRRDVWAVGVHAVNLWGEGGRAHLGWSIRGECVPFRSIRFFGGAATYADTEAGLTRRVNSAFLGASVPLTRRLGLRIAADHEVRRTSYRRDGLTLGLAWRLGR